MTEFSSRLISTGAAPDAFSKSRKWRVKATKCQRAEQEVRRLRAELKIRDAQMEAASRQLRASEQRFRSVAEAVPDMLFAMAIDGSPTYLSARFQEYIGSKRSELRPDFWDQVLSPEDLHRNTPLWREAFQSERPFEAECRFERHDGVSRWFLVRAIPIRNESQTIVQWLGGCTDIDRLKRTETALRYSNHELQQFAYAAAHDLQEPLRNVVNAAGLLEQLYRGKWDAEADEWMAVCIEGATRMHGLVKDLLTYSRVIDPSTLQQGSALSSSEESLQQALANLATAISESGAEVSYTHLPAVPVPKTHLLQLFQNLIGNALKYRKCGSAPAVQVEATQEGAQWMFSITDNGIGFNPAYAQKIFGVFKRLHHRHEYPGNGIGLAICARIVTHYGGHIWAEGQPGVGATFRFTLPVQENSCAANGFALSNSSIAR